MKIRMHAASGYGWLVTRCNMTAALRPGKWVDVVAGTAKVCVFSVVNGAVMPAGAVFVCFAPSSGAQSSSLFESSGCSWVDHTAMHVNCAAVFSASMDDAFGSWWAREFGGVRDVLRDRELVHRYKLESDTPAGMRMPVLFGMPALGLAGWTDAQVKAAFKKCEAAAVALTGWRHVDDLTVAQQANVSAMLFVAALRVFGGAYRSRCETIDDRTIYTAKLHSNGDCDDMAVVAAAMALRLGHAAWVVQGRVAVDGMSCGHTWGVVTRADVRLHLEATDTVSCLPGALASLYGGAFSGAHGGAGVKRLVSATYARACAVYTADSLHVPYAVGVDGTRVVGVTLPSLLGGAYSRVSPPVRSPPVLVSVSSGLRASPGPAALDSVLTKEIRAALTCGGLGGARVSIERLRVGVTDPYESESYVEVTPGNFLGVFESPLRAP